MTFETRHTRAAGRIVIANTQGSDFRLTLEPWADEIDVPAGQSVGVTFEGPALADIHIEVDSRGVTIYGWTGSVMAIENKSSGGPTTV